MTTLNDTHSSPLPFFQCVVSQDPAILSKLLRTLLVVPPRSRDVTQQLFSSLPGFQHFRFTIEVLQPNAAEHSRLDLTKDKKYGFLSPWS